MITAQQMTKVLFLLETAGLSVGREGQTVVWTELVTEANPKATDEDLMEAARSLAKLRTSERGGSWITVGDLIAAIKKVRNRRLEIEASHQRQIEAGQSPVTSIDIKQLMADAASGLSPEEVGRRARERAEGSGDS